MVQIFKGKDIDCDKIKILKNIAYKRYAQEIYEKYFSNIKDINDLANLHGININRENLVIGTDWFLCYYESYYIQILEWVSIDNENKIRQVAEMMNFLKDLFI